MTKNPRSPMRSDLPSSSSTCSPRSSRCPRSWTGSPSSMCSLPCRTRSCCRMRRASRQCRPIRRCIQVSSTEPLRPQRVRPSKAKQKYASPAPSSSVSECRGARRPVMDSTLRCRVRERVPPGASGNGRAGILRLQRGLGRSDARMPARSPFPQLAPRRARRRETSEHAHRTGRERARHRPHGARQRRRESASSPLRASSAEGGRQVYRAWSVQERAKALARWPRGHRVRSSPRRMTAAMRPVRPPSH